MDNKRISELLRSLRKAKGYTQQQVADALHISPKTVSKWENAEGIPDITIISSVAELYEITIDELLKGKIQQEQKEPKKTPRLFNALKSRVLGELSTYIYIAIIAQVALIIIATIVGLLVKESKLILFGVISGLGIGVSSVIVLMGRAKYKNQVLFEEDENIIYAYDQTKNSAKKMLYYYLVVTVVLGMLSFYFPLAIGIFEEIEYVIVFSDIFSMICIVISTAVVLIYIQKNLYESNNQSKYLSYFKLFIILMTVYSIHFMINGIVVQEVYRIKLIPNYWFKWETTYFGLIHFASFISVILGAFFVFIKKRYLYILPMLLIVNIFSSIPLYLDTPKGTQLSPSMYAFTGSFVYICLFISAIISFRKAKEIDL
ncbi:Transcriptional regulator [Alteracholeplasma palmae J233]|uniref:Transcriptional regulator n=1 Tax=Alteracholeplasma palmae (strain ATCC 49389 / J233) TaxID=1318466 RepID=U4KJL7_ALTPJ|nr:helix-turn-helix transcriptional regulator [Alteracholeplasma palmae]CCV63597.1 Transcriptional regulator [Alteracholeplasma palmae J233]